MVEEEGGDSRTRGNRSRARSQARAKIRRGGNRHCEHLSKDNGKSVQAAAVERGATSKKWKGR